MAVNETSESVKFDTRRGRLLKKQAQNEGIDDEAITTAKIADAAITNPKIGSGAVNTTELADSAVTDQKVSDVSVPKLTSGNLAAEIRDDEGVAAVDSGGIKSDTQFTAGYASGGGVSTTSTTYADVTGATLTITLDRQSKVYIWCHIQGYGFDDGAGTKNAMIARMYKVDGHTIIGASEMTAAGTYIGTNQSWQTGVSTSKVLTLAAGTHEIRLEFKTTNAGKVAGISYFDMGYLILGK